MGKPWTLVYDVVERDDRDHVITSGLTGTQDAPNIINACEKMRREVENDPELNGDKKVSAFVTGCTLTVTTLDDDASPDDATTMH
jgi:hypothetical protein